MQAYGLVRSTLAGRTWEDIEPVDDAFIGVKYYEADEVDELVNDLKAMIYQSMEQTDEVLAMYRDML